jgi:hypothetical protein
MGRASRAGHVSAEPTHIGFTPLAGQRGTHAFHVFANELPLCGGPDLNGDTWFFRRVSRERESCG